MWPFDPMSDVVRGSLFLVGFSQSKLTLLRNPWYVRIEDSSFLGWKIPGPREACLGVPGGCVFGHWLWLGTEGHIGRNGLLDKNPVGILLLNSCASNGLSITNMKFKQRGFHKCIWLQNTLCCTSMINFKGDHQICSHMSWAFSVEDTWLVRGGAELTT